MMAGTKHSIDLINWVIVRTNWAYIGSSAQIGLISTISHNMHVITVNNVFKLWNN